MDIHLFPGQGSQYKGMTSGLQGDPWVSEMTARAESWAWNLLGYSFGDYLRSGTSPNHDFIQSFLCDQLRILLGSLSLHHMLWLRGITAHWRIGHSLGEISALTAAGWMDVDTSLQLICLRSKAIVEHAPPGGMTAILAPLHRMQGALEACGDLSLTVSTVNSPGQATVSGLTADLEIFENFLEANGIAYKRLNAKYPFHGPMMAAASEAFAQSISRAAIIQGAPVWSAIFNRPYTPFDNLCQLLATHLVLPVQFSQSISQFAHAGVTNYVEVGGRRAISGLVRDLLNSMDIPLPRFIPTSLPGEDENSQAIHAAWILTSSGHC